MSNIRPTTGQIAALNSVDKLQVVFSPARPTLETIKAMWPWLEWCGRHHNRIGGMTIELPETRRESCARNRDIARHYFDTIPDFPILDQARSLFDVAEHVPADDAWLPMAFDAMLMALPNAAKSVSAHTVSAYVDLILNDPEVWQGYKPGFSYAVMVRAIRQSMRENKFVPSPAEMVELLQKQRRQFLTWQHDVLWLHNARDRAEDILLNLGEIKFEGSGDDEVPF
ncbi:hypothetical protein [Bradyrhizobium sp. ORS 86]|uniref:hypothetical protein n=1 Tax=Bradyrhizobium sp. ORS 86 TaxID=1685970 RepID=UPI00388F8FA9